MSSIPNRHTDGDVSVGRNVTTGGSANIQGNARVGHNLRVEGWLEAPNIVGPLKGLYATAESLRGAYPEPRPGWYALVGDTLPAAVYRADRDERGKTVWAATGETGGEFVLYPDKIEREVGELRDDVRGLEGRLLTGVSFASEETYGTLSLTRSDGSVGASVGIPGMTEGKAGLMTPTRLAAIRSEMTQTATDALLGVSYEAFDDHGTIWLTLPSGNRKGVGIPGMTESKAGLLTPNRLAAIRAEIQEASAESLTGIEIEQLDTFARVWSTTQGGRRSIAALLTAMDGETAGLYSPTRHRQIIGLIEQSAAAGVSRGSEALTFAASETYGTLSLTRSDGTRASAAIPGMTDGKAGLMTPTRLAALRAEISQTTADTIGSGTFETYDDHGTIWLTLPSGAKKGIGIPGMTEGKAGLLTPARLEAIRAEIRNASAPLSTRLGALERLVSSDSNGTIDKFNEIVAFLEGIDDRETLDGILQGIASELAAKADNGETAKSLEALGQKSDELERTIRRNQAGQEGENLSLRNMIAACDERITGTTEALTNRIDNNKAAIAKTAEDAAAGRTRLREETGILPFEAIVVNEEDAAWAWLTDGAIAYHSEAGHFKEKGQRSTGRLDDYNENMTDGAILARRDRLYRLGNRLYAFDGTTLGAEGEPARISDEEIEKLLE